MLRRHFMTMVKYKPNIIVKYHADKKVHLFNDENINKIKHELSYYFPNGNGDIPSTAILINNSFDYGVGYWEIYCKPCIVTYLDSPLYGKTLIGLFCDNYSSEKRFYENDEYITFINMNINVMEDENVYFTVGSINNTNLNKLILPSNLSHFPFVNCFAKTNLTKLIIPTVTKDSNYNFVNKHNNLIQLIFTTNKVPEYSGHKYGNIKCPPNLVDKYKEYYPNATAANNILYIKKVTRDADKNINFDSDRDVDNELYITKNYTDDGYTEINIINYNDFKNDISSCYLNNNDIVDVIFPETITQLNGSFVGKNLTKLTIPKNVIVITDYFLQNLLILEENLINLSSLDITTMQYYNDNIVKNGIEENGCVIGDYIDNNTLYKNTLFGVRDIFYKNIIIPEYVEVIKPNAFYGNNIDYVFISKNINTISPVLSSNIFSYTNCVIEVSIENKKYDSRNNCNAVIETQTNKLVCGNKLSVIPDNVKIIGTSALDNTYFDILDLKNVESILTGAFQNTSIKKLILNNTITNIENHVCYHVENVVYKGTIAEWNNIFISSTAFRTGTIIHCVDGDITHN